MCPYETLQSGNDSTNYIQLYHTCKKCIDLQLNLIFYLLNAIDSRIWHNLLRPSKLQWKVRVGPM